MLTVYLNSQYSVLQNLDFFVRILAACLCGAAIGLERSKRFKEAGIRTHIIVCCAAAVLMLVSKYGFADLTSPEGVVFHGTRGADPARIAAQVVSGISFLGAGVIFKHGSSIRGLTTAAGLWTTAGIGLALGAGMYPIGIFATVLVCILQVLMHRFLVGADSMAVHHLKFTVTNSDGLRAAIDQFMEKGRVQIVECTIRYLEDHYVTYDVLLRTNRVITMRDLERFLTQHGEVREISFQNVT